MSLERLEEHRRLWDGLNNFRGSALPLTVLIDASGNVVRMYTGFLGMWEKEIDQQLSELVAAGSWQKKE